jgi:predicted nuclease of predicted toxin-antitoxin system
MNFLIDMNLSPKWVQYFQDEGWHAKHWSEIGSSDAPDTEIMEWATQHQFIVFTHDLDFGSLLALTNATSPSVIQVRTPNVNPKSLAPIVIPVIKQYEAELQAGSLIVISEWQSRIRILPLK